MKRILTVGILAVTVLVTGCTRIETGEVGVRVDALTARFNRVNCCPVQYESNHYW
jgi:hypothetical protein